MNRRVLIVDDHPLVSIGLQLALRARGWEVETIAGPTGDAVVGLAGSFQPGCVLLDLNLGVAGSGRDLVAPLRNAGAAVVMLTRRDRPVRPGRLRRGRRRRLDRQARLPRRHCHLDRGRPRRKATDRQGDP